MIPPLSFERPWAFALLILVLLVPALGRRRSGPRWRAATALRTITLGLLVLALSGPLIRVPVTAVNVVFALDRSLSIAPGARRAQDAFVRDAVERMRPQDRAGVVVFAGRALMRFPADARPAVGRPRSSSSRADAVRPSRPQGECSSSRR